MAKSVVEIDGSRFADLQGFYAEISRVWVREHFWGHNLNAFNDILRGGFGSPDGGFTLVWKHSALSRERLGRDFDTLLEIIRVHGPGGEESEDSIDLILE